MEKIINALLESIRGLGVEAVLSVQQVSANRPRIELYLSSIEPAGIDKHNPETGKLGWERIIFNALFKSEGTHNRWVNDTIIALRKLQVLHETPLQLKVEIEDKIYLLEACWKRLTLGRFEYPDEEESSMPVRYVENWEVTVAYPANIIGHESPEEEI